MIRQPQYSHTGAILWIAHSKLSNTCLAPAATTSNTMSYSFPQTSQVPIGLLLSPIGASSPPRHAPKGQIGTLRMQLDHVAVLHRMLTPHLLSVESACTPDARVPERA